MTEEELALFTLLLALLTLPELGRLKMPPVAQTTLAACCFVPVPPPLCRCCLTTSYCVLPGVAWYEVMGATPAHNTFAASFFHEAKQANQTNEIN